MSKSKSVFTWYVVSDAFTNETIANELAKIGEAAEREVTSFTDSEGIQHSGWDVPYAFVDRLEKNSHHVPYKFKIFVQKGRGKIFPWLFLESNRSTAKVRKVKEDLKKIQEKKKK